MPDLKVKCNNRQKSIYESVINLRGLKSYFEVQKSFKGLLNSITTSLTTQYDKYE